MRKEENQTSSTTINQLCKQKVMRLFLSKSKKLFFCKEKQRIQVDYLPCLDHFYSVKYYWLNSHLLLVCVSIQRHVRWKKLSYMVSTSKWKENQERKWHNSMLNSNIHFNFYKLNVIRTPWMRNWLLSANFYLTSIEGRVKGRFCHLVHTFSQNVRIFQS